MARPNNSWLPVPDLRGRRLVIVEDAPDNRLLLAETLGATGAAVETMESAEALLDGDPQSADLILMDIRLPGIDGLEATRLLREAGATLPVITLSGYLTETIEQRARAVGVTAYLTKPVDVARLYRLVAEQLGA